MRRLFWQTAFNSELYMILTLFSAQRFSPSFPRRTIMKPIQQLFIVSALTAALVACGGTPSPTKSSVSGKIKLGNTKPQSAPVP
jgi:hypothetical protein